MNTMKRIFLGTTLLALAALCGRPAHAAPQYSATVSGVSPQGGTYNIVHDYGNGTITPASIPIAVAQQSVQVTGAAPSSSVSVSWNMTIQLTVQTPNGSHAGSYLAQDYSNGTVPVPTKPDGSWQRIRNFSQTYTTNIAGSWAIDAASAITDDTGHTTLVDQGGKFTTADEYIV